MIGTPLPHYPRPALAREIVDDILGRVAFGDGYNGIFLAGPRRTGKTDFIKMDVRPALEAEGAVVVMADLWANKTIEPSRVIASAIGNAINDHLGLVAKLAKNSKLKTVTIAGALSFDASTIGATDGITFADALKQLITTSGKPVVLMVDEAQHALTTEAGEAAMFALKSARDMLNGTSGLCLMLLMTGSDRDKLSRLVTTYQAPFFGSRIRTYVPLGADYIEWTAADIEWQRPDARPVNRETIARAFEMLRQRPQFLRNAITDTLKLRQPNVEDGILEAASRMAQADEDKMVSLYLGMSPLQQAVLCRMLDKAGDFRPYDANALAAYAKHVGKKVLPGTVQKAIEQLRLMEPTIVWKSARGEYAVDDSAMYVWHSERVARGAWPPA